MSLVKSMHSATGIILALQNPSSCLLANGCKGFSPASLGVTVRSKMTNLSKKKGTLGWKRTKVRGVFREDGEWVTAGTILVKQLGLLYFPGLNVGLGRNWNLYAKEHGRLIITTEKANPDWDSELLQKFYGQYEDTDIPLYKTYLHVIPNPIPQTFKLIDQI